jgi:V-type H+-transporting ATPase subunit E
MTAFIRQEALEKAKEIQIKADEEFAIEKSKLVRQETASIDTSYEKKFKHASMSQQITRSTVANKSRLRILSARQEVLDELFEQAGSKLKDAAKDKSKYRGILKNLILEGMYALNEPRLQVRARKADYDLVKEASKQAEEEYKKETGKESKLQLDEVNPQPEGSYVLTTPIFWSTALTNCQGPGACPLSAAEARSTSTTLSRNDYGSWRARLCLASGQRCLARTRTAGSTIESLF